VAEGGAVDLGDLFNPFADLAAVNHHIVIVSPAGDLDDAESCEPGFHGGSSSLESDHRVQT